MKVHFVFILLNLLYDNSTLLICDLSFIPHKVIVAKKNQSCTPWQHEHFVVFEWFDVRTFKELLGWLAGVKADKDWSLPNKKKTDPSS